jgi:DNA-binding CsgD family transcriptional regulator
VVATDLGTETECDNPWVVPLPVLLQQAYVTPREAEVLQALGARLTNAEIAEELVISVRTVESHVSALLGKLAVPDRRALAVVAHEVFREPTLGAVRFPAVLADTLAAPPGFREGVGRVEERARLYALIQDVAARRRRHLAVIAGDSGIGKTWLAATAAQYGIAAGALVLHGRCDEQAIVPFQALIEAIEPLVAVGSDPRWDAIGASITSAAGRYALFERFDRLLAARPEPILLVIDDAQWADPSGLQLLRHLMRHVDRSPLLVIATTRPEGLDPLHPLAAALATAGSEGSVEVLPLEGLSLTDVEAIAVDIADAWPERVRDAWTRTGGNPFFVRELLRRPADEASLPATARDAIARRIAGLGVPVAQVLTAAAIAGEGFRPDVVSEALGGDRERHAEALDTAYRAGLVGPGKDGRGECRFAHAIIREALVAVTPPSRQVALHLALAAVLERMPRGPTSLPDIAHHRHAALPAGDPVAARRAALAAASAAMNRYAYEVGASCAGMALDALDAGGAEALEDADRAAVLLVRGTARLKGGDLGLASDDLTMALDLARRAADPNLAARAVLGWSSAAPRWERNPELRAALEEVLAHRIEDRGLRAELRAALVRARYFDQRRVERLGLAKDAIRDARAARRPETLASVLATIHAALWAPEDLDERAAMAEEVVAVARSSGHADLEASGLGWLVADRLEAGDVVGADHAIRRHAQLATRLKQRLLLRDVELWRAMRAMLDGHLDTVAPTIERARDLGEAAHDPAVEPIYWVQRYWLACERGQMGELDDLVGPCERFASIYGHVPAWRAALALLHARRDDRDAARQVFETLAADDFTKIPRDFVWLNAMTYLAEACAYLGDADRAVTLYQYLLPFASRVALIDRALACKGSVARYLGLLAGTMGDASKAVTHLEIAAECHDAMGARPLAERARRESAAVRAARPLGESMAAPTDRSSPRSGEPTGSSA